MAAGASPQLIIFLHTDPDTVGGLYILLCFYFLCLKIEWLLIMYSLDLMLAFIENFIKDSMAIVQYTLVKI